VRIEAMRLDLTLVKPAERSAGIPCFSIIRNEAYFLPHFLRHYRGLGIENFIFYDDGSNDGSREYLCDQRDCTIVTSNFGFRETMPNGRPFHYVARTRIPEHFAKGGWSITVDADEFLLLPSRFDSLQDLIGHLERHGQVCAMGPMIDLYPASLVDRNYPIDTDPFAAVPWWFDAELPFRRTAGNFRITAIPRGVRLRLAKMLQEHHPERFDDIFTKVTKHFIYSKLWKVPLLKTGQRIIRLDTHSVNAVAAPDVQLALAHFRFYPRLDAKIADAVERGSYARGSQEYRFLEAVIELFENESLICKQSRRFEGAGSLEAEGLMF